MITLFLRDSLAGDNLYTYDHDNKTTSSSSFVKLISANCFHGVIPPGTTQLVGIHKDLQLPFLLSLLMTPLGEATPSQSGMGTPSLLLQTCLASDFQ